MRFVSYSTPFNSTQLNSTQRNATQHRFSSRFKWLQGNQDECPTEEERVQAYRDFVNLTGGDGDNLTPEQLEEAKNYNARLTRRQIKDRARARLGDSWKQQSGNSGGESGE